MNANSPELRIAPEREARLSRFLTALIDQDAARVVVYPCAKESGFWFGGGNVVQDASGVLWIVGRYRNAGDSRTGTVAGTRGFELALFKSTDQGQTYEKVAHWSKQDLSYPDSAVISIEGASLLLHEGRAELYVSSEKEAPYPDEVEAYRKPGTGVWSVDVFAGSDPESLDIATLRPALSDAPEPGYLHVKDPVVYTQDNGDTVLVFCNHPFTWTSVNTGFAVRPAGQEAFTVHSWEMVNRGTSWDVGGTRITARMAIPLVGAFADQPPMSVYFYDSLECYREHEQNVAAHRRVRGHSCEEIAGALYGNDADFPTMTRLSRLAPLFVSPNGTGCSRYIETLATDDGIHATWQQSQPDGSQPLVTHFLPWARVEALLG